MKKKIFRTVLLILSLLATIKIWIIGLGVDEEYAVTMAYRIVSEDRMFLEMWEPHQTSGFLSALLIKLYMGVTGSTDGVILYLRMAGTCLQALISVFLYRTLKREFREEVCFAAAVFFYNTLPKWIQTPEFANMLVWFGTMTFLCLFRYYTSYGGKYGSIWLVGAGSCLCGVVLAYPSCILAVPVILLGIWMIRKDRRGLKEAAAILGTCMVLGTGYLLFFLMHMSLEEFLYGLGQMTVDGSHSAGLSERFMAYVQEMLRLLPYVLASLAAGIAAAAAVPGLRSLRCALSAVITAALAVQMLYWLGGGEYLQTPLLYFHGLYFAGIILYFAGKGKEKPDFLNRVLFWTGSAAGGAIWLSALVITNTTISVTGSYLMPGILTGLVLLAGQGEEERDGAEKTQKIQNAGGRAFGGILYQGMVLCLLGVTLFAKGFLICSVEGRKDNVMSFVRQKALSGPAKNIYCRYMDGYSYNEAAGLLKEYTEGNRSVLYVGQHSLYYMLGEQTIGNYSTISTPTFDERLVEYWERYPEHMPELVLCDTPARLKDVEQYLILGDLLEERELIENEAFIRLYEVTGSRK